MDVNNQERRERIHAWQSAEEENWSGPNTQPPWWLIILMVVVLGAGALFVLTMIVWPMVQVFLELGTW